jgi:squalene-hopene/tetraprenyl-beta-curcumene cyclase
MIAAERLRAACQKVRSELWAERTAAGHWVGQLSTSALSTATAVSALALMDRHGGGHAQHGELIAGGVRWLAAHQSSDGGWGDTDRSYSNIATTMLVRAAYHLAGVAAAQAASLALAERYIDSCGGIGGLRRRYGRDKTFAVPILTNCALAGLVPWPQVPALPFELACLPPRFYRFARLPVVSYAIPALVAIGQVRFAHAPPWFPLLRWLRWRAIEPSLRVLQRMQPDSGGYLEATPLTSFVVMSLAGAGRADHPVARLGVKFLEDSVLADGSWPIDTNLATWTTTLTLNALAAGGEDVAQVGCLPWLLACQHRRVHPFTGAEPGGWGWTDLSGAVPDADDTPGALLALAAWRDAPSCAAADRARIEAAALAGMRWLLDLQNRDGGWPTFCRGWGKLPFDRSGADLTAHALRALHAWPGLCVERETDTRAPGDDRAEQTVRAVRFDMLRRMPAAVTKGFRYLENSQRADGSWLPLWFGNQDQTDEDNPVYGTARVLLAYCDWKRLDSASAQRAVRWLCDAQNADGGWGGGRALSDGGQGPTAGSVEETAVAVETLACALSQIGTEQAANQADAQADAIQAAVRRALDRGVAWLVEAVETDRYRHSSPIGFYFAKLWYYEKLYPLIFSLAALGRILTGRSGSA